MHRFLYYARVLFRVPASPFTGELNPRRMSSEEAKTELDMLEARRDESLH